MNALLTFISVGMLCITHFNKCAMEVLQNM